MTEHITLGEVAVDYDVVGTGDPVVLVHARPFVSWYSPLVEAMSGYTVLRYRRTLPVDGPEFSIDDDADVCTSLLEHVGFDQAHVVGHSYGGLVALALAQRDPVRTRSIALLEPSAAGFATLEEVMAMIAPMIDAYRSGGPAVAMELFLTAVAGTGSREQLDRLVPEAFDEAVVAGDQFFHVELPAVARWSFGPQDAGRIDRPVLNVVGGDATLRYVRTSEIVQELLPHADRFALPGAGHLLMAQNPEAMAERLDQFWRTS
jgi:pimeloyl-ACP methyl ester carboxylesterase